MSPIPQCQVASVIISYFQGNLNWSSRTGKGALVVKLGRQVYSTGSNTALSMQKESFIILCMTSTLQNTSHTFDSQERLLIK